jgi:membrane protein DedA with SNARE-associated domain
VVVLAASTLGSVAGALLLYGMGRWGGRGLVLRYGGWLRVGPDDLSQAEGWFARYGDAVVLVAATIAAAGYLILRHLRKKDQI